LQRLNENGVTDAGVAPRIPFTPAPWCGRRPSRVYTHEGVVVEDVVITAANLKERF